MNKGVELLRGLLIDIVIRGQIFGVIYKAFVMGYLQGVSTLVCEL